MLNEERIILMTHLAAYETNEAEKSNVCRRSSVGAMPPLQKSI